MAYQREYQGVRNEVPLGRSGTVTIWPKVQGQNVTPEAPVSTTVGAAAISGDTVIVTLPAATDVSEGNELEVSWTLSGTTYKSVTLYDVVRVPYEPVVSLNQMQEDRPDVTRILDRIASTLNSASPPTAEETASIYVARARVEIQDRMRQAARGLGVDRPSLLFDPARLGRAERALALAYIYGAIARDPDGGTDDDSSYYRHCRAVFEKAWGELGPVPADIDGDGETDTTSLPTPGAVLTSRSQG